MQQRPRILVIGDTLFNRTYRARPAALGRGEAPVAFLNEELLTLDAAPQGSIQGAAYIARFLRDADPERPLALLTETRSAVFPGLLRAAVEDALAPLLARDPEALTLEIDDRAASVVTRVLRDVAASRSRGPEPEFRPQLRIDTPAHPLPLSAGRSLPLPALLDRAAARLAPGDLCLLRALTREFFGGYDGTTAERDARALAAIQALCDQLRGRGVGLVLDLRPLPLDLRLAAPDVVISTTIGRVEDALGRRLRGHAAVEAAFWRLAPARAMVVFAADEGVWLATRGDLSSRGELHRLPITWPKDQHDGCGMVTGGDAFVAALTHALARGCSPLEATKAAAAALCLALQAPLGHPITPPTELPPLPGLHSQPIADPDGEPIHNLAAALRAGLPESPFLGRLVAPLGGKTRALHARLTELFTAWQPRPSRDLIAIFGESRSGKEFPLKEVLRAHQIELLGPVNMHQFLAETGGVLAELHELARRSGRRVALMIDEVVPDDASRSLLNLMADKTYHRYGVVGEPLSFVDSPVILLSSIDPQRLLRDMQGRLLAAVEVAPLRERTDELPYVLPWGLGRALGGAITQVRELRISERALAALLAHDYRPIPGAPEGVGLDQQNFRALEDLLAHLGERALARAADGVLSIESGDLPALLQPLAPRSLRDDAAFIYHPPFDRPAIPQPPPA